MEFLTDLLPELVTLLIAAGIAVARTTENAIDNKVFKIARDRKSGIVNGLRSLLRDEGTKRAVREANDS